MRNIEQDCPRFHVLAEHLDKMEINRMKHQRQCLQKHQHRHYVMDFEHRVFALPQYKHPKQARQQEQNRHHKIECRQRHFAGRQKTATIALLDIDVEMQRNRRSSHLVIGTRMEIQIIQALRLFTVDPHDKLHAIHARTVRLQFGLQVQLDWTAFVTVATVAGFAARCVVVGVAAAVDDRFYNRSFVVVIILVLRLFIKGTDIGICWFNCNNNVYEKIA